jgi:glycerophosphoryl diester phosphodiesterase
VLFHDATVDRTSDATGPVDEVPPADAWVARAHERGLAVRARGLGHRFEVQPLIEAGVDGAAINWPDWLA